MPKKPLFLVLEGLDACGKTTVAGRLAQALGAVAFATPLPELQNVRPVVDQAMQSSALARMVWYAANNVAASDRVRGLLAEGKTVILDRYWLTTRVYSFLQGAQATLAEIADTLQPPDLTFLLSPPHETRIQRLLERSSLHDHDRYGLSAHDEAQMLRLYRSLASHPLAGRLVELPFTADVTPDALVTAILGFLT